jgi:hypothetical protein
MFMLVVSLLVMNPAEEDAIGQFHTAPFEEEEAVGQAPGPRT